MTRVRENRNLFDVALQRHRGGTLEGLKNSSSKRIVLVKQGKNKVLVDINKGVTATDKVKNKKETLFNM